MRGNHSQVDLRPINCLGLTGIREFLKELASKKRLLYLVSYQDLVSKMDSPSDRKNLPTAPVSANELSRRTNKIANAL